MENMVNSSPIVSVIMNGLNCQQYLREAIDSVFAQTFTDWEIVFFDNCSSDDTAKIAQSYGSKLRYFKSEKTVPLGAARNLAIEKAKGQYIAFLDCDDLWLPYKLERQVSQMKNNPEFGMIYSDALFFYDNGKSFRIFPHGHAPQGRIFSSLLRRYVFPMPTVMVRKDVLDQVGGLFDPRFNMVEDADFFMRVAFYFPVKYVNDPLAKRRMHQQSWTALKKELFPKEEEMLLQKFASLLPGFEKDYTSEIEHMKAIIAYQYAVLDWENGNNQNARQRMAPYLKTLRKMWVPFLFSYFPISFYKNSKHFYKSMMAPFTGSVDDQVF